ncbi:agmatine deiminase [Sphingomonas naasensis]|uniref:Agmatine deiminase family protein n=1 Tax=Sphingomonas naasensis TaxID=1344951 RepID=A0A4S1WKJ2_9SPHN|nr:agmatine deiminase family protein [Sphingomonas naasensis]NIJ21933.1 agmatine deiminase [Sphingomonas naasensis]TGX42377.1 agmatine deiminase family protein [Sphingomonas naasensis]
MILPPPPEWAPHDAVWIGFPSHPELWLDDLEPARAEVAAFARAVHAGGRGETVILVAADEEAAAAAREHAGDVAKVVVEPFGDIWLRDTGPILDGAGTAHDFRFNGWGGKYDLPGDGDVGLRLARREGRAVETRDWILEGGAIDGDGTGLAVTTEQCLLNPNRNPGLSQGEVEARLAADLGYTRVLWLGDGLLNDHTDGHVDNLARFVGENRLLIPQAADNDPNWRVYQDAAQRAAAFGVEVVRFPSPGRVLGPDEEIVPASYMNFYIGNAAVVVPVYGEDNDDAAIAALAELFPGRQVVGQRADHILTGGGSFHCISQQLPRL